MLHCTQRRREFPLRRKENHYVNSGRDAFEELLAAAWNADTQLNAWEPGQSPRGASNPVAAIRIAAAMTSRCVGSKTWPAGVATGPRALCLTLSWSDQAAARTTPSLARSRTVALSERSS